MIRTTTVSRTIAHDQLTCTRSWRNSKTQKNSACSGFEILSKEPGCSPSGAAAVVAVSPPAALPTVVVTPAAPVVTGVVVLVVVPKNEQETADSGISNRSAASKTMISAGVVLVLEEPFTAPRRPPAESPPRRVRNKVCRSTGS